ncbi:hypothetical protein OH687_31440 [Burkholderia anthina]|nr:hypothetical protein OH687_31440 [Burkholderia anthina]
MIFSDRHRSLSFLYIQYIDIPAGTRRSLERAADYQSKNHPATPTH